jgi:hypothetical protein
LDGKVEPKNPDVGSKRSSGPVLRFAGALATGAGVGVDVDVVTPAAAADRELFDPPPLSLHPASAILSVPRRSATRTLLFDRLCVIGSP